MGDWISDRIPEEKSLRFMADWIAAIASNRNCGCPGSVPVPSPRVGVPGLLLPEVASGVVLPSLWRGIMLSAVRDALAFSYDTKGTDLIKHALRVVMSGVLLSALACGAISASASETEGTTEEAPKASTVKPTQVKLRRAAATPAPTQPATPQSRKLYQHTTKMGKKCCASCEEIASNGSCKVWGQCSSTVSTCDAWTD